MVRGEGGNPLELKQGMGPHLQMRWDTQGSSRVVAGNSAFISSCDGDLWAPAMAASTSVMDEKVTKPHPLDR